VLQKYQGMAVEVLIGESKIDVEISVDGASTVSKNSWDQPRVSGGEGLPEMSSHGTGSTASDSSVHMNSVIHICNAPHKGCLKVVRGSTDTGDIHYAGNVVQASISRVAVEVIHPCQLARSL